MKKLFQMGSFFIPLYLFNHSIYFKTKIMKKVILNPLELDKETIAQLDEAQLGQIIGGVNLPLMATSTGCGDGGSGCGTGGNSTGCGSGGSTCIA
ncbi:class I lanthipeptide [Chitinophaga polysaccharea]|uniref:class I lanthipeptide n=1 Tax=Chitinophaga polysaccharea TaxID=1293035 RepID=UPI0011574C32|nr:class I lanthipeptide [Chitinophaga polysaccharea]